MNINYLTIDPGVNGTGFAVFNPSQNLVEWGTLHYHPNCETWIQKFRDINEGFKILVDKFVLDKVFIESPVFMHGSEGYTVASTGDLCKLAMLVGGLLSVGQMNLLKVELVTPTKWKGQLPKKVCERRIRTILEKRFKISLEKRISNHAIDAIGIGLWAQRLF